MPALRESLEQGLQFIEMGGPVLWGILLASLLLWILVIERYWFMLWTHRTQFKNKALSWQARSDRHSWFARQIRRRLLSEGRSAIEASLPLIKMLTSILPLLGLLGTVNGMISTFDVMTRFGTDNARGMASGISEALITTMAGLVTALSGLYFNADLKRRAALESQRMADLLPEN